MQNNVIKLEPAIAQELSVKSFMGKVGRNEDFALSDQGLKQIQTLKMGKDGASKFNQLTQRLKKEHGMAKGDILQALKNRLPRLTAKAEAEAPLHFGNKALSEASWPECKALAREKDILACLGADMVKAGVVGNLRNQKFVFLALISRLFENPLSGVIKGSSSSGKSFAVNETLKFVPKDAYIEISAMSNKAMIHDGESYKHRVVVITEASGILSEEMDYFIRILLSEHKIDYKVSVKNPETNRWTTDSITKEGPIGSLVTTTRNSLHDENETRYVSLTSDDSEEMTGIIIERIAAEVSGSMKTVEPDFERWHALHNWLQGAETRVIIPFAKVVAQHSSRGSVRARRDVTRVCTTISANAVLHQATRKKTKDGAIIATIDDYKVAYDILADGLAASYGVSVSTNVRKVVKAVENLVDSGNVSVRALSRQLSMDNSNCNRAVNFAMKYGYLKDNNPTPGAGRSKELGLGDVVMMAVNGSVLPTPEFVESKMKGEPGMPS